MKRYSTHRVAKLACVVLRRAWASERDSITDGRSWSTPSSYHPRFPLPWWMPGLSVFFKSNFCPSLFFHISLIFWFFLCVSSIFILSLKELQFIHKSCSTVGYRPNVFSTTLSHLIATNSSHLIMPFIPIRGIISFHFLVFYFCFSVVVWVSQVVNYCIHCFIPLLLLRRPRLP